MPSSDPLPIRLVKRLALVIFGLPYFAVIALAPTFCRKRRGFRGWYWRAVKRACSWMLRLLSIRVEMSEADKAALAADENSVIVINHGSNLDGFTLMDTIPDQKWFTFAAKKELFDSFALGAGFRGAGLVEIDRKSGKVAMQTLSAAVRDMPARRSVVLFPEGTRTKGEVLGPFKAGAVVVARETGRHIRPLVILGARGLLPRGRALPLAGKIRVMVLPPFVCDPAASVDEDVARLRATMAAVLETETP